MKTLISCILLLYSLSLCAQKEWNGPSVDFLKGQLRVSENGHYLIHSNGNPFFYLGDTAWELFHRLSREEAELYLENRRSKGFTVIQAVVLAEFDGLNDPNFYGETPLINNDLKTPNEKYFQHVDWIIKKAEEKGLYIGLLPTWGDKVDVFTWGIGPEIFDVENASIYGKWIGNRYKDAVNIIWINGGDRSGGEQNTEIWNALGSAIKSVDKNHLMSFHPWGGRSSSDWFQESEWLDFNMMQSGHSDRYIQNFRQIERDRSLQPTKPAMDAEPCYEDHAINWDPAFGWFDAADVRQMAYWGILAGACGTSYGAHPVWQFYDEIREPVTHARMHWEKAIDLPGSLEMMYLRSFFETQKWQHLTPQQDILLENSQSGTYMMAARGEDFAVIYSPQTTSIKVDHSKLFEKEFTASWFNPRNGKWIQIDVSKMKNPSDFTPEVTGIDWVLLIEANPVQ